MKHGHALAIGLLALALVACGGGDGGGRNSSSTDPNLGLTQDYRVEARLSDASTDPNYTYQDPLNLQVNDRVIFELVYYTGSGANVVRHVVPTAADTGNSQTGVTFTSSAPNGASGQASPGGSLSQLDGQFSAPSSDTGSTRYTVTAFYQGGLYQTAYRINPQTQQIRLRGRVVEEGTGLPVYNAVVDFYSPRVVGDATSRPVVVSTVRTAYDGTFRASIRGLNDDVASSTDTVSPLSFTIRRTALPDGAGRAFLFRGNRYDLVATDCRAPLVSVRLAEDDGFTPLPFRSGERYLVLDATNPDAVAGINGAAIDEDPLTNGTIQLATADLDIPADGVTVGNGCAGASDVATTLARVKASVHPAKKK